MTRNRRVVCEDTGIHIQFMAGYSPSRLEIEYIQRAVAETIARNPELPRFLSSVTFRKPMVDPRNFANLDDDQRFVLRFLKGNAHYTYTYGPVRPGQIEIDYTPYVDFLTAFTLHELAHVLVRADDPDASNISRSAGQRHQHHRPVWSQHAAALYTSFGCEKAALFLDGCNYRSVRRHYLTLMPEEAAWARRVWKLMDQGNCGELRAEFTELFVL